MVEGFGDTEMMKTSSRYFRTERGLHFLPRKRTSYQFKKLHGILKFWGNLMKIKRCN